MLNDFCVTHTHTHAAKAAKAAIACPISKEQTLFGGKIGCHFDHQLRVDS